MKISFSFVGSCSDLSVSALRALDEYLELFLEAQETEYLARDKSTTECSKYLDQVRV